MKKRYHAIPFLIYVPADSYPEAFDAYDAIITPIELECPGAVIFVAGDFEDGLVEIDHDKEIFSAEITEICERSL